MLKASNPPTTEHQIRIRRGTLEALRLEAQRRGVKLDELASALIESVVEGDLYAAVLGA
jgi:hypothetical protein